MGKVKDIVAKDKILYLIVIKEVWDRIVKGDKVVEYRERTDYWDKRINARHYDYVKISNGYGNDTRPYRLYQYTGATRVVKDSIQCYAIGIHESLIIEKRDKVNGTNVYYPDRIKTSMPDELICHYSGLPSTSSYNDRVNNQ